MLIFAFWVLVVWYIIDFLVLVFIPSGHVFEYKNSDKIGMLIKYVLLFIVFNHIYSSGALQ